MPTIFTKNGFRFFFYSADGKEPMHVHVEYGGGTAKFWIHPLQLAYDEGLKTSELKQAGFLIVENIELIEERWNECFRKQCEYFGYSCQFYKNSHLCAAL